MSAKLRALIAHIAELVKPLASAHGGNAPLTKLENLLAAFHAEISVVDNTFAREVEQLKAEVATLSAQLAEIRSHPALSIPPLNTTAGDSHG